MFFTKVFVAHLLCNRLNSFQSFLLRSISRGEDSSRNHAYTLLLPMVFWAVTNILMLFGYFSVQDGSRIGKLNTLILLRNRRGPCLAAGPWELVQITMSDSVS